MRVYVRASVVERNAPPLLPLQSDLTAPLSFLSRIVTLTRAQNSLSGLKGHLTSISEFEKSILKRDMAPSSLVAALDHKVNPTEAEIGLYGGTLCVTRAFSLSLSLSFLFCNRMIPLRSEKSNRLRLPSGRRWSKSTH